MERGPGGRAGPGSTRGGAATIRRGHGFLSSFKERWPFATLFVVGLATGVLTGLVGVGGGILFIPALVYLFGLPEHEAHGTSVATVLPTATVSAGVYLWRNLLDVGVAWRAALGGVLGALVGAYLMKRIPSAGLRRFYAVFLAALGVKMLFTK